MKICDACLLKYYGAKPWACIRSFETCDCCEQERLCNQIPVSVLPAPVIPEETSETHCECARQIVILREALQEIIDYAEDAVRVMEREHPHLCSGERAAIERARHVLRSEAKP